MYDMDPSRSTRSTPTSPRRAHPAPLPPNWKGLWSRGLLVASLLLLAACTNGPGNLPATEPDNTPAATPATSQIPTFSHVFVILMENEGAQSIYGNSAAPYINQLASQYASLQDDFAVSHPSLPNYIALTSGTPNPLNGTDCSVGSDCRVPGTNSNLADEIEASGHTWVAYMESMPAPCTLQDSGNYAVRHNPFVYYDDIRTGANDRCATHDLPFDRSTFQGALARGQLPDFVWITPNLCDDGHDTCGGDPISHSDAWLASIVPAILASPAYQQNGALFITWDEGSDNASCCGLGSGGGQVASLILSPLARQGYQSTAAYTHYSLLSTIEQSWHLGLLNNTSPTVQPLTQPLNDIFALS